jgi:hypothetical protein
LQRRRQRRKVGGGCHGGLVPTDPAHKFRRVEPTVARQVGQEHVLDANGVRESQSSSRGRCSGWSRAATGRHWRQRAAAAAAAAAATTTTTAIALCRLNGHVGLRTHSFETDRIVCRGRLPRFGSKDIDRGRTGRQCGKRRAQNVGQGLVRGGGGAKVIVGESIDKGIIFRRVEGIVSRRVGKGNHAQTNGVRVRGCIGRGGGCCC